MRPERVTERPLAGGRRLPGSGAKEELQAHNRAPLWAKRLLHQTLHRKELSHRHRIEAMLPEVLDRIAAVLMENGGVSLGPSARVGTTGWAGVECVTRQKAGSHQSSQRVNPSPARSGKKGGLNL